MLLAVSRILVSPRMAASAGHDKVMRLVEEALPPTTTFERVRLARPAASARARLAWGALEAGKAALARLDGVRGHREAAPRAPGPVARGHREAAPRAPGPVAGLLEAASVRARRSGGLSRVLTAAYGAELKARAERGERVRVVSSHYLALAHRPPEWPATLVGPDLLAQSAVEGVRGPRVALSPGPLYTDGLMQAGFRAAEVLPSGSPLSRRALEARVPRLEARTLVARGEAPARVLLTIGGSAPEGGAAVRLARALAGQGVEVGVLVGDDRLHARRLRAALEGAERVEVFGGITGFAREAELEVFTRLLEDPSRIAWITRPNEAAPLALALGFELWLLPPYQPHERATRSRLVDAGILEAARLLGDTQVGLRPETPSAATALIYDPSSEDREDYLSAALDLSGA